MARRDAACASGRPANDGHDDDGTVETLEERLEHLLRLRDVQDETGGFTAFITWSYQPQHTELGGTEATGVDYSARWQSRGSFSTTSTTCRRRG